MEIKELKIPVVILSTDEPKTKFLHAYINNSRKKENKNLNERKIKEYKEYC